MALVTALIISVLIALGLQVLVLPLLGHRTTTGPAADVRITALRATLELLRTVSLIAALAFALVLLIVGSLDLFGHRLSSAILGGWLNLVQQWRAVVESVGAGWTLASAILLSLALLLFAHRRGKRVAERRWRTAFAAELARLEQAQASGDWLDLPPTPEMQALDAQIHGLTAQHRDLAARADAATGSEDGPPGEPGMQAAALEGTITELRSQHHLLDLLRRVDPEQVADAAAATPGADGLRGWLTSRGMVEGVQGISKLFLLAGLALLFLSVIGVATGPVSDNLVVRLADMQVRANQQEAAEDWTHAAGQPAPAVTADKSSAAQGAEAEADADGDAEALDQLADLFEQSMLDPSGLDTGGAASASVRTGERAVRASAIRARVLATAPAARQGRMVQPSLPPLEAEVVALAGSDASDPLRERFKAQVREEIVIQRPALWASIKGKLAAAGDAFNQPATTAGLRRAVIGQVIGMVADTTTIPDHAFAQISRQLAAEAGTEGLNRAYEIKARELMAKLAGPATMEDILRGIGDPALARVATTPELRAAVRKATSALPDASVIAARMADRPPALAPAELPGADPREAERLLTQYAGLHHVGNGARYAEMLPLTESLADYNAHFPPQLGAEWRTRQGTLIAAWGPQEGLPPLASLADGATGVMGGDGGRAGGPPGTAPKAGGAGNRSAALAESRARFRTARSYLRVRGFARVGGVVIGRDANAARPEGSGDGAPALDFIDLTWEEGDAGIMLTFVRADGQRLRFGPFAPTLVKRALLYAADARPVTVTMTTARPLRELRILLHPALEDSVIGCHAIDLDRLVDISTSDSALRQTAEADVEADLELYRYVWALRTGLLLKIALREQGVAESAEAASLRNDLAALEAQIKDADLRRRLDRKLAAADADHAFDASLVAAKPEFFDIDLVAAANSCVGPNVSTTDGFDSCLRRRFLDALGSGGGKAMLHSWMQPSPELITWSGVREQPYTLDPDLQFLCPGSGDGPDTALWPFRFMLQVAFQSEPVFAPETSGASSRRLGDDDWYDAAPWEYPSLQQHIEAAVLELTRADATAGRTLHAMARFALLQRMFRSMLNGDFGPRFPLQRLHALALDVANADDIHPTLRWNSRPGQLEQLQAQILIAAKAAIDSAVADAAEDDPLRAFAVQADDCLAAMQDAEALSEIPPGQWSARCGFSAGSGPLVLRCSSGDEGNAWCIAAQVTDFARETEIARRLRTALGADRYDHADPAEFACPPLPTSEQPVTAIACAEPVGPR